MFIKINVGSVEGKDQKMVSMEMVGYGYKPSLSVKLIGSTVVIPINIPLKRLSIEFPDGLNSIAFDCLEKGPFRCGSGNTAYLDTEDRFSLELLLAWWDNGKLLVKAVESMSGNELSKFNHFTKSGRSIMVFDTVGKIAYFCGQPPEARDSEWKYKSLSGNNILRYITKWLTMEQLNELVTDEQAKRDELEDLKSKITKLTARLLDLESENKKLKNEVAALDTRDHTQYRSQAL